MPSDVHEIKLKLVIDGSASESVLELTNQELNKLKNTLGQFGKEGDSSYKRLTEEAFRYKQANEQTINGLYEWMQTQSLSTETINKVITGIDNESAKLNVNSTQWQESQIAIQNLTLAKNKLVQSNLGLNTSNVQMLPGQQKLNMAMGQFGYVLNDAQVFTINFRMGLMGISNNLPMIIQLFMQAKTEIAATGGTISKAMVGALTGPGGLMIAINGVMLLLTLLPSLFNNTTDSIHKQKKGVDELKTSYEKMTRAQLDSAMTEKELALAKLKAKERTETFTSPGGEAGHKLLPTKEGGLSEQEKERVKELEKEIKLINDIALKTGDRENISRRMNINEERLNQLQIATLENYNDIISKYNLGNLSLEEQKKKVGQVLEGWIKADRELHKESINTNDNIFKKESEKLKIVQSNELKMKEIAKASDYEILLLKHTHLQQILELYKQYGKDVTEIQYQIKENIAEQETYKAKPKDQAGVEWMNEIDVADSDLEQQRMSETDLAKLRIDSIENEWQRKRELADWEYQQQIKTYENYENFEQIKTELDKQYATSRKDIAIQEAQSKLEIMSNNLNSIKALFGEHTAAYKILTIFNTLIDTYQAAIAAYKSTAEIPIIGPALAPFAATSATLFGMSQVANIEKTQIPAYEKGGFGIVGEKGLEVIAPMQDYAHGQSELVKTTLIALENTLLEKRYSPIVANNNMSEFKSLMEEQFRRINDWQNKFEFSLHGEDLHTAVRRVNTRITESEF